MPEGKSTEWAKRAENAALKIARLQALRDERAADVEAKTAEIAALSNRIELLAKVGELLRVLLDRLVTERVRSLEGLVTEGLKTIFHDQSLVFEAEIGQSRNKIAIDFYIRQGTEQSSVRGHPLDSFGGGPASIASLILRFLLLLRLKRFPFFLLDETLAAVSDEYVDAAGRFLQRLAQLTKVDILLVTHKHALLDHADHAYQGSEDVADDGSWSLGIRRLRHHSNPSTQDMP